MHQCVVEQDRQGSFMLTEYLVALASKSTQPAIRWGHNQEMTWAELYRQASSLAQHLIDHGALVKGECVAVGFERSAEFIVASYAVLLAGGVYCPIDPKQPPGRLQAMLKTANCRIGFGDQLLRQVVADKCVDLQLIDTQQVNQITDNKNIEAISAKRTKILPEDGAYLIFTSGTTGQPKGVLVNHGALINRLEWHKTHSELTAKDIILQRTAVTFDVSLWELFLPALVGASHYLLQPGFEFFPKALIATLQESRASVVHFVPSLLKPILQELQAGGMTADALPQLRQVYVSGEAWLPSLVTQYHQFFGSRCRLTNLYGPTEAAIDVTFFDCTEPDINTVPIGHPLQHCELNVVDPLTMAVKSPGEVGELAISGVCLAEGYLQQQEMTNKVFIEHVGLKKRIYLTGDLGWQDANTGLFYWQSRKDTQIKLNGLRIELGEIEHHLLSLAPVKEAVVVVVQDPDQQQWLVAALQGNLSNHNQGDIRKALSDKIPSYMMPARFWMAEALPRTSSGKHDRKMIAENVRSMFFPG